MKRVAHEPAYVLHRYAWSETSLVLEAFTRHHGRVALVAKGAKRPSSNLRPILLPLQPLHIAYSGDGEVRTLKGSEWAGGHTMPTGDALLAGTYANELLLRLMPRDDPHAEVFDAYAGLVEALCMRAAGPAAGIDLDAVMRAFELLLLRGVGVLPQLDEQGLGGGELAADRHYRLVAEAGLRLGDANTPDAVSGPSWSILETALSVRAPWHPLVTAVQDLSAVDRAPLRRALRHLVHYHCGMAQLQTHRTLVEARQL